MPPALTRLVLATALMGCILSGEAKGARVIPLKAKNSDVAIVLVHGLEGSAETSFTNVSLNLSWPELISSDSRELFRGRSLSQSDIYAIDYSDVFTDARIDVSIEEMAQQVSDAITSHGLVRDYNHVWFIAHSLGGILIKRAIVKWSGTSNDRYLHHILGVSLLGVPSNGAPLANVGDSLFGKLIAKWLGINARHVTDLNTIRSTNTYRGGLENDWAQFISRRNDQLRGFPKVYCAYETAAEYRIWIGWWWQNIQIVPTIYANTQCDGEKKAINKIHTELPKPSDWHDPIENWLFESVRSTMLLLHVSGETIESANEPGALWRKIRLINSGHNRTDRVGVPLVDQYVEVPSRMEAILGGLRLRNQRYVGATWADVLESVGEENSCVTVDVRDMARRDILLLVEDPVSCPVRGQDQPSWACDASLC